MALQKLSDKEESLIYGGFAWTLLTAIAPVAMTVFSTIASLFKMAFSTKGEYKAKDGDSIKWDNASAAPKATTHSGPNVVYMAY